MSAPMKRMQNLGGTKEEAKTVRILLVKMFIINGFRTGFFARTLPVFSVSPFITE